MDTIRKAAVFLLSLDKPLAAKILSRLPKQHVERVTLEIARISDITPEQREAVFEEFAQLVGQHSQAEPGGLDLANDLLQQSLGRESAGEILENVRQSLDSVPFRFLQKADAETLLALIIEEHPQTIALILSYLPESLAADVLSGLPREKQSDVIQRVANMEETSPEVIHEIEQSLEGRLTSLINQPPGRAGGLPRIAQILNITDRTTHQGILKNLEQEDRDLAHEIQRLMFVFDDLLTWGDQSLQKLLPEVDLSQWALALKGASEQLTAKVLGQLSQSDADALREEMEYLGPVRISDVEATQQQIVDIVRRLEQAGAIIIAGTANTL